MSMLRFIPSVVINDSLAYHTINHKLNKYVGDPFNIVKILSDLNVDEISIIVKDSIAANLLQNIAKYSRVPISIVTSDFAAVNSSLFRAGFDRVGVKYCKKNEIFISEIVALYGSSSIILTVDINQPNNDLAAFLTKIRFSEIIFYNKKVSGRLCGPDMELITGMINRYQKYGSPIGYEGGTTERFKLIGLSSVYYASKYIFSHDDSCGSSIMINPI
ncbi:hypothetical protein N9N36_02540 [Gammaproteobacteria bacterium]|nr:hypothetical protein [Gammaproteobacteria bacterium]